MKKVLVITPVYNGEKFIRGAIESILQQDYPSHLLHHVIIDDCSTDDTVEEIKKYLPSDRITLLQNKENRGTYYCRNRGLKFFEKRLEFDIVTNHDADDISYVSRISKVVKIFKNDINTIGVIPRYMRIENSDIQEGKPLTGKVKKGEGVAFYSREAFNKLGYYDNTRYSGDTDYWQRAERYCKNNPPYRISHFLEITYLAINHGKNLTIVKPDRSEYMKKVFRELEDMEISNDFYRPFFN